MQISMLVRVEIIMIVDRSSNCIILMALLWKTVCISIIMLRIGRMCCLCWKMTVLSDLQLLWSRTVAIRLLKRGDCRNELYWSNCSAVCELILLLSLLGGIKGAINGIRGGRVGGGGRGWNSFWEGCGDVGDKHEGSEGRDGIRSVAAVIIGSMGGVVV